MEKPNRVTTVGQLRAALEGLPDDTPLIVNAADQNYPDFVDEQVITSTGFGLVDWGDGYGLEPDNVFALNCHADMLSEQVRRRPVRPARQPEAETAPPAAADARCRTCGAVTELHTVTSRSLADGAERTEWFCADASACNDRRFPELAATLATGSWPGTPRSAQPEAELAGEADIEEADDDRA